MSRLTCGSLCAPTVRHGLNSRLGLGCSDQQMKTDACRGPARPPEPDLTTIKNRFPEVWARQGARRDPYRWLYTA